MKLFKALAIASAIALVVLFHDLRRARAHEDKTDPVCGMRVDPDVVPWKADYAGETYYFCMEEDRKAFLADPERFAGALTLVSAREGYELVMVVRPRAPVAGTPVKLAVRGFALGDRMASPPLPSKPLEDVTALVYPVDRGAPPRPESYRLARLEGDEEDVYGLAKLPAAPGEWRVVIDGKLDGARRRGIFSIAIAPVSTATSAAHAGHDHGAPAPARQPEPTSDPGSISMAAQHDVMKVLGREWYALGALLREGRGSSEAAARHLAEIERQAREIPKFALHKFPEAIEEFRALARSFDDVELPRLRPAIASGRERALEAFRELDARSCTKCHLKFRWGAVEDLSRFPDLRALGRAR